MWDFGNERTGVDEYISSLHDGIPRKKTKKFYKSDSGSNKGKFM